MVMLHIKLKTMKQELKSKGQIIYILESVRVTYRIKWKEVQTTMQSNTLTLHTPLSY